MPSDADSVRRAAQRQFDRQAARYTTSSVHSAGGSLSLVAEMAGARAGESALDIATGAGFTAFALAAGGADTIATDIAPGMLVQTRANAGTRGLNVRLALALAESLPFAGASFDVVACRLSPHHFGDLPAAVREMSRVLRRGGRLVVCDTLAPEDAALAGYQHDLELRRDPSHVRNRSPSQWRALLAEAGLRFERDGYVPGPQEFQEWVERAGVPEDTRRYLRGAFLAATPEAREEFGIESRDGTIHWRWTHGVFRATKP